MLSFDCSKNEQVPLFALVNKAHLELGETIRQRRQALKVTQAVLADISGVARHTITDIESGKGNPTIEVMRKLLAPLGLKLVIEIAKPSQTNEPGHETKR